MHRRAHLMALVTGLVWSFSFVCIRDVLEQFKALGADSWTATLALFQLRMTLSTLAFLPNLFLGRAWITRLERRDWLIVVIITLTMSFGYHLPLYFGARDIPSGFVSLLVSMSPVFASVLARLILGEHLGVSRVAAVLLGLVGIAICLTAQGRLSLGENSWGGVIGPIFVLLAAFDGAVFAVVGRRLRREIPVGLKLALAMILTMILAIPLWNSQVIHLITHLNFRGWLGVTYLAVVCTHMATLLWYQALKTLDTVEVTIYLNVTTTLAIGWGALLFHETLNPLYLLGACCIVTAVFLASRRRNAPEIV